MQLDLDLLGQLGGGRFLVLGLGLGNEHLGHGPVQLEPGLLGQLRERHLGLDLIFCSEHLGLCPVHLEPWLLWQWEGVT